MNIKEKAKKFAIKAHMGQVRKSEPDKPMIMHPISVGMMLEEYGYDDQVVAAGYLHDVVEDTKYTIEDIEKEFGQEIANLVMGASEPDKSLSWEERKKHTIEETKILPLRNKLIVCADKINNLEDMMIIFERNGKKDFSAFKRGEKDQKWYFTNVYESLINNEDKDLPIFKRLKNVIEIVFEEKEDISNNNIESKKIHARKIELKKLKSLCKLSKPFIIEMFDISIANNLYKFFSENEFDTVIINDKAEKLNNHLQTVFKSNPEIIIINDTNNNIISEERIDVLITTSSQNNLNSKVSTIINSDTNEIEMIMKILISMRKKYIEEFKEKYNLN